MKRNIIITLVLMLAVLISACTQATATPTSEAGTGALKIGMANFSQCCPYFIGMNNSVLDEGKAFGNVSIVTTDANGDAAKFQSDIEDLIAQNVDGVIVSGAWLEEAPAALDALKNAGIPTVLVDRQFGKGSAESYTSYIGPDNFTIGVQDGKYIAERLGGKGVVVELRGGPADNSIGLNRSNGVNTILSTYPDIVVVAPVAVECGWRYCLMEDMLAANPKSMPCPVRILQCACAQQHRRCRSYG
jgi:ribose transport system substrate-binding protein